jgi:trans-2,3-dihydro-3-hydroxyanthranilate isomerase
MAKFEIIQVDAFTNTALGGNPCAVLFGTDMLDNATMLAIAKEMNLSETAFVSDTDGSVTPVRYFTPAEEIPLAGHPTIATAFALVETGRVRLIGNLTTIHLALQVGIITVDILADNGKIQQIIMTQQKPIFMQKYDPNEVMPVFGLSPKDVLPGAIIQTVSTGTPQLMVLVRDKEVLRRAQVDIARYTKLRGKSDFFSPHLFCLDGITPAGNTFARHFGIPPDTPEDPFTGSATGGMAAFLWHYGWIENPIFIAEQGHWLHRPGFGTVEVIGPRNDIQTVKVGGGAVAVMQGTLQI